MAGLLARLLGRDGDEPLRRLPIAEGSARAVTGRLAADAGAGARAAAAVEVVLPAEDAEGRLISPEGVLDVHRLGPTTLRPGDGVLADPDDLHRIAELTVVLAGRLEHRDALGNRGEMTAPSARLVSSGAGLRSQVGLHPDLVRDGGAVEVLTIRWAQAEAVVPTVRLADDLPELAQGRARVQQIVGPHAALPSPDGVTVTLAAVPAGSGVHLPTPPAHRAMMVVLDGELLIGDTSLEDESVLTAVPRGTTALLGGDGTRVSAATRLEGGTATALLLTVPTGLGEEIGRRGQLVHDGEEDLAAIKQRIRDGAFGQLPRT